MYLQGWDLESGWHLVRWSPWDENLGQVRLTFCQMAGWLANCSWMASYWTKCHLCIDVKDRHPTRSHLGSGWHDFRWLGGWPIAAGWLTISKNVNLTLPWGSDFGFWVRQFVGLPIAAGWLASNKMSLWAWADEPLPQGCDLGEMLQKVFEVHCIIFPSKKFQKVKF